MRLPKLKTHRKGQQASLSNLPQIAIAFVVVGIVIAIGALINSSLQDNVADETDVTNESLSPAVTSTPLTLQTANSDLVSGSETLHLVNNSSGALVGTLAKPTNYSVLDYETGEFNITDTSSTGSNIVVNASYTHRVGNNATAVVTDSQSGLTNISNQLPTIGLVIGAVILLAIVVQNLRGL